MFQNYSCLVLLTPKNRHQVQITRVPWNYFFPCLPVERLPCPRDAPRGVGGAQATFSFGRTQTSFMRHMTLRSVTAYSIGVKVDVYTFTWSDPYCSRACAETHEERTANEKR